MKNSEFKVGSIVVVDCDSPSIKYKVTKQTKEGMYVEVYETNQYNHQHGPYNDTGIIKFKLDPYTKQFFPEPGDTIVCKNGQKFACVKREDYRGAQGKSVIFGHCINGKGHQDWAKYDGSVYDHRESNYGYDIQEIIPAKIPELAVYSVRQVAEAIHEVAGVPKQSDFESKVELINKHLSKVNDPEWKEYQRLREKFNA